MTYREVTAFRWNNSGRRSVTALHQHVDMRRLKSAELTLSTTPGGVRFGFAGLDVGRTNVLGLLERRRADLGPGPSTRQVRTGLSWSQLLAGSVPPDVDILLLAAEERSLRDHALPRSLLAPLRLHLAVDVSRPYEVVNAAISKRERWEFSRHSKDHTWQLHTTRSRRDLAFFYERMHLPTMLARHPEQVRSEPFAVAEYLQRTGALFLLTDNGNPVAGALCQRRGPTLVTRLLGVLDGAAEHYDSGAFKAIYHHLTRWSCDSPEFKLLDFFGTEAFFSKGIFQWKRKFNPKIMLPPNHFHSKRLLISLARDTPAVRQFMIHNPLFQMRGDESMQPVYFHDRENKPRLDISAKVENSTEPFLVSLDKLFSTTLGSTEAYSSSR